VFVSAVAPPQPVSLETIEAALRALVEPGSVVELRVLKAGHGGTVSGYFDDVAIMAAAAATWDGKASGVYFTHNPVNPELLARAPNRVVEHTKTNTADREILRRRRFLVDLDPTRPTDVAATNEEHEAAIQRAREIQVHLLDQGWPKPVAIDSGNGCHLVYGIDLPNDEESKLLVHGCLKTLASQFDDSVVHVDTAVGNASRIIRVPGTWNLKGEPLARGLGPVPAGQRPHRRSILLFAPDQLEVVPVEKLQALASSAGPIRNSDPPRTEGGLIPPGFRHDTLKKLAASLLGKGIPTEGVEAALLSYDLVNCEHPVQHEPDGRQEIRALARMFPPNPPTLALLPRLPEETVFEAVAEAPPPPWPTLREEALIGLAGDFVRAVEPHTEADPVALLVQFVVYFGTLIGHRPHLILDGSRHALNENVALVGPTSKGRKGTSQAHVEAPFKAAFSRVDEVMVSGLSSGQGLIWRVRDPTYRKVKDKSSGKLSFEIADPGVDDKRLLVVEHELARVLRIQKAEGNTLSTVQRDAFDGRILRDLVKHGAGQYSGAVTATDAHISITGHITDAELRRTLTETDIANGFANRYLWLCVKRSKVLPRGGGQPDLGTIPARLKDLLLFADEVDEMTLDEPAWAAWERVYSTLSEGKPGLVGALLARGEVHVMRFAALYALLSRATVIQVPHLLAALALWDYAEASVRYLFGQSLGDPEADAALEAIRLYGDVGATTTDLHAHFGRNLAARNLHRALTLLREQRLVRATKEQPAGSGRPSIRYHAVGAADDGEDISYLDLARGT
jgi:hypothetical protein